MRLKDLRVADLYELSDELDAIMRRMEFNSTPHAYRRGVQRMRTYLDHVASGLRMIRGGRFEAHDIQVIHHHNRAFDDPDIINRRGR